MDWHDRITVDPKVLAGKPVIRGTRIAVEFVVDLLGRGWTTEQILHEYDHLTSEDIQACLSYASDVLKSEPAHSRSAGEPLGLGGTLLGRHRRPGSNAAIAGCSIGAGGDMTDVLVYAPGFGCKGPD